MNDSKFQTVVTSWMASEAYNRLRAGSTEAGVGPVVVSGEQALPPALRLVEPTAEERYVECVPFIPLKAAGAFGDPQHVGDDGWEWVAIDTRYRLRPGMFVAQVVGKSMEPSIPDGSYCFFSAPVAGTRQGKTVLVQLQDGTDPESGEQYTVKRYESEKAQDGDSWLHTRISLKPTNPDFQPIVLTGDDEGELQVVAEVVDVFRDTL